MSYALVTGPISGVVTLANGEVVDVSPPVIVCDTEAEVAEIADLIGRRHVTEGHPSFLADPNVDDHGFIYEPPERVNE
jgi:hypothetical protein